ncbi:hypothetical protein BaRGS_00028077 [Batillaria attramentaria]|uniref:Uncharacterized protein n=1 Tax=Batillaria attramentaria TaxID=370345 RepID=A0ABD0K083_9CAEN
MIVLIASGILTILYNYASDCGMKLAATPGSVRGLVNLARAFRASASCLMNIGSVRVSVKKGRHMQRVHACQIGQDWLLHIVFLVRRIAARR